MTAAKVRELLVNNYYYYSTAPFHSTRSDLSTMALLARIQFTSSSLVLRLVLFERERYEEARYRRPFQTFSGSLGYKGVGVASGSRTGAVILDRAGDTNYERRICRVVQFVPVPICGVLYLANAAQVSLGSRETAEEPQLQWIGPPRSGASPPRSRLSHAASPRSSSCTSSSCRGHGERSRSQLLF